MNMIFKLLAFSIMLNFAIGILIQAVPAFNTDNPTLHAGLSYNESYARPFVDDMSKNVSPTGALEDSGDALYRVLDMMNIGMLVRFLNTIKQYLYGFIQLLEMTIGGYLDVGVRNFLFGDPENLTSPGVLYVFMTIGYIMGGWYLWSGKNITANE